MKARHGKVMTAVLASALLAGSAFAGTPERLGTGGNSEGRILVGARSVGLAYSNVASVKGAEALFGNPAGLSLAEEGTEVLFSTTSYLADMNVNYIALAQKVGGLGTSSR